MMSKTPVYSVAHQTVSLLFVSMIISNLPSISGVPIVRPRRTISPHRGLGHAAHSSSRPVPTQVGRFPSLFSFLERRSSTVLQQNPRPCGDPRPCGTPKPTPHREDHQDPPLAKEPAKQNTGQCKTLSQPCDCPALWGYIDAVVTEEEPHPPYDRTQLKKQRYFFSRR